MDLFLSPHNDDETLFGAFTILRHKPHVVVCLKSQLQESRGGPTAAVREAETNQALWHLGSPSWEQSLILDNDKAPGGKLYDAFKILDGRYQPLRVWAPAIVEGGHEDHTLVGQLAQEVFGDLVVHYHTYVRGQGRTKGTEVEFEPLWVSLKMRALSCYRSQIALLNTRFWFMDDTLREYYAP